MCRPQGPLIDAPSPPRVPLHPCRLLRVVGVCVSLFFRAFVGRPAAPGSRVSMTERAGIFLT